MAVTYACSFEAGLAAVYTSIGWTFGSLVTLSTSSALRHLDGSGVGGTYALAIDGGANPSCVTPGLPTTSRWVHAWVAPRTPASPKTFVWSFLKSSGATFFVRFNSSGYIELLRGTFLFSATVIATSATTYGTGVGHWIAVELLAASSGGAASVWVDGVELVTFSGDTAGAASDGWDQIGFAGTGWGTTGLTPDYGIEDLLLTDATTGRLDEQYCQVLRPVSVVSGNLTGTGSTGSARWENLDDAPADTADYNAAAAADDEDLYGLGNLAASPEVVTVAAVWSYASRSGSGVTASRHRLVSGASDTYQASHTLPSSGWLGVVDLVEEDPATSAAWTEAALAGLQVGIQFRA